MPTKPRTKKPAAKPQRKPRKAPTTPATAEDIGRSIGDALGRRLEDLLKPRAEPAFNAVSAWVAMPPREDAAEYCLGYAEKATIVRQSALNNAIDRLRAAISAAEVLTDNTHGRLQDVLSPPVPTAGGTGISPPSNDSPLTCAINDFADRIYADNRRRNELLDRLEL